MDRLDDLTLKDLHEQLERTERNTPTQRILAAIGRKQGATLGELAERHNDAEKTIRNWLDRFAEQPLQQAPYDEQRSGQPARLSGEARDAFLEDLQQSPDELGHDHHASYPALARHHLSEEYGVEYSLRHVYRSFTMRGSRIGQLSQVITKRIPRTKRNSGTRFKKLIRSRTAGRS